MVRKSVTTLVLLGVITSAYAITGSSYYINTAMADYAVYKVKGSSATCQFTISEQYSATFPEDPKMLKTIGTMRFYVSDDQEISQDDKLLATKKFNLKDGVLKFAKIKLKVSSSDKGQFILFKPEPKENYVQSPLNGFLIELDAF